MTFKKITNNKTAYCASIFAFSIFLFGYNIANAATLRIDSSSATLSPGGIATLSVVLNSEGVAINNAEAKIIFPADLLEIVSISKGGSIFSLWVEEPTYSNIAGNVTFNGGIPAPGFTGSFGNAISLVVRAKKAGQADLIFSDAAVRANDGLGTDVLSAKTGKTISIVAKEEPVIKEIPNPESIPAITALQITSPTHPSQELWYKDTSPIYRWKVPTGVDAIQTGINNNTSGSPRVTYSPAITEKTVNDLDDGVWYFKVRARKGGEWGPISTYIVRIDNTTPKNNNVVYSYDDAKKVLNIESNIIDETSGLDYYEIYINGSFLKKVSSKEFVGGSYDLAINTPGDNTIKLVAVDRAGNSIESIGYFKVTAVDTQRAKDLPSTSEVKANWFVSIWTSLTKFFSLAIPLLALIFFLIFLALYAYNKIRQMRRKVNRELHDVEHMVDKAFALLKEDIEDSIHLLEKTKSRRRLTEEEAVIVERFRQNLQDAERVIHKQMKEIEHDIGE